MFQEPKIEIVYVAVEDIMDISGDSEYGGGEEE